VDLFFFCGRELFFFSQSRKSPFGRGSLFPQSDQKWVGFDHLFPQSDQKWVILSLCPPVVGLAGPAKRCPEGVTSSSGLTSQLSPDPRRLLG